MNNSANSRLIASRLLKFSSVLFLIQFLHLTVFIEFKLNNYIALFYIYSSIFFILVLLYLYINSQTVVFKVNYNVVFVFLLIGLIGKLFSRYDYVTEWLIGGLHASRTSGVAGTGGWYSYLSIFFYPAAILWSTVSRDVKKYKVGLIIIVSVILIDFIFVGTRNAPIFVSLFFFLNTPYKFKLTYKRICILLVMFVMFMWMFEYTSSSRLLGSSFSWKEHLINTNSTEIVRFRLSTLDAIDSGYSFLFPFIYLTHYLSHSIGELSYLIDVTQNFKLDTPIYFLSEVCVIKVCDKSVYEQLILDSNIRAGVYQTFIASFAYDFGLINSILFLFFLGLACLWYVYKFKRINPVVMTYLVFICLGPIENYFYGGLGLIQLLVIFFIYYFSCFVSYLTRFKKQ